MSQYIEKEEAGDKYRIEYLASIEKYIKEKQKKSYQIREKQCKDLLVNQEEHRARFIKMLGSPLTEYRYSVPEVTCTQVATEDEVVISRLQIKIWDNFVFYGILFRQKDAPIPLPLVIVQHGGQGTPELCSGFYPSGSANYNDMTRRVLKKGVHVFAPQLLLWNQEKERDSAYYFDRQRLDTELKQVGSSITALEVYCLRKSLDYLQSQDFVKEDQIGMVGLSYGSFYTLYTAATDTRIRSAICSSQFNDRIKYNWSDWTWYNSANTYTDAEIALLVYPRKLYIGVGDRDDLFDCKTAEQEFQRMLGYQDVSDRFEFQIFQGEHEFMRSDAWIEAMVKDLKDAKEL